MQLSRLLLCSASALVLATTLATPAHADNIAWTNWTADTAGSPGSASGTLSTALYGNITVSYSGQTFGLYSPSWGPASTFTGGVVGNAPPAANSGVGLVGGGSYTETITFSKLVADPIFAVWSLGAGGTAASFNFTANEPFTVQGGGPSNEYGGTPLYISGQTAQGNEGNGIIQFNGNFSSIIFTTPQYENYYAFTIGEDDTLTTQIPNNPSPTPEPSSLLLMASGLVAGAAGLRRRLA